MFYADDDTETTPEIPQDKIDLYLKVSALAEKGSDGEREQAARTLAKMRIRFPGIEFVAEERIAEERRANRRSGGAESPRTRPAGTPKEAFWSAYTRTFESVSKILSDIDRLFGEVSHTREAIAAVDDTIEAQYKTLKIKGTERFRLILDIDADVLGDALASLESPRDIRALADHVGNKVADALAAAFAGDDDDNGDDEDGDEDDDE